MADQNRLRSTVWRNIYRLVLPHKGKFLWVVTLSLLSTGANLLEPLIYREAINDVAGLFVSQAREEAAGPETDLEGQPGGTTIQDTLHKAQKQGPVQKAKRIPKKQAKKRVKEPHSRHHVAPRSPDQALDTLIWAVVALFVINLVATILWRVSENKNVKLSCLIEQRFIQGTFAHVINLPLRFFSKRSTAAIAKQIDQSEEVSTVVNGFAMQVLPELISLTGILAIMFYENIALTSISLIIIPFYLIIAWRSAKKLESGLSTYYERWEEVSTRIQDALAGIKTVKLSGAEQKEAENLSKISSEAYADYVDRTKRANKYVFWETMLTHLSTALVLGYGGYLTLENKLTPGDVVMFVTYLDRLYGPIDSLASLWVNLQQNVASIARAFRLLQHGMEEKAGKPLRISQGRVEFREVRFSYTQEREILKNISFVLEPGKATALVGSSGAGKTTTVDLLLKLYEPSEGDILIDGQSLAGLDPSSVRRQIGMVSADGAIFSGTLLDNIRYKRPDASPQEALKAAIDAGLGGTLERLPDGLQTKVGENGVGLSVGERQRIQIARVLAAHPPILVLDEATANLDFATEAEVKKTIGEIRKQHTVLIIAHRYNMVRDVDHVIVLSDGEIIDQGAPQELAAKEGWFAEFASSAEEGYEEQDEEEEEDKDVEDEDEDLEE